MCRKGPPVVGDGSEGAQPSGHLGGAPQRNWGHGTELSEAGGCLAGEGHPPLLTVWASSPLR